MAAQIEIVAAENQANGGQQRANQHLLQQLIALLQSNGEAARVLLGDATLTAPSTKPDVLNGPPPPAIVDAPKLGDLIQAHWAEGARLAYGCDDDTHVIATNTAAIFHRIKLSRMNSPQARNEEHISMQRAGVALIPTEDGHDPIMVNKPANYWKDVKFTAFRTAKQIGTVQGGVYATSPIFLMQTAVKSLHKTAAKVAWEMAWRWWEQCYIGGGPNRLPPLTRSCAQGAGASEQGLASVSQRQLLHIMRRFKDERAAREIWLETDECAVTARKSYQALHKECRSPSAETMARMQTMAVQMIESVWFVATVQHARAGVGDTFYADEFNGERGKGIAKEIAQDCRKNLGLVIDPDGLSSCGADYKLYVVSARGLEMDIRAATVHEDLSRSEASQSPHLAKESQFTQSGQDNVRVSLGAKALHNLKFADPQFAEAAKDPKTFKQYAQL
jgi:hypothetical protein